MPRRDRATRMPPRRAAAAEAETTSTEMMTGLPRTTPGKNGASTRGSNRMPASPMTRSRRTMVAISVRRPPCPPDANQMRTTSLPIVGRRKLAALPMSVSRSELPKVTSSACAFVRRQKRHDAMAKPTKSAARAASVRGQLFTSPPNERHSMVPLDARYQIIPAARARRRKGQSRRPTSRPDNGLTLRSRGPRAVGRYEWADSPPDGRVRGGAAR